MLSPFSTGLALQSWELHVAFTDKKTGFQSCELIYQCEMDGKQEDWGWNQKSLAWWGHHDLFALDTGDPWAQKS